MNPATRAAHWNLGTPQLLEHAIRDQEGTLVNGGAFVVRTGQFTGRSPKDKYVVREKGTEHTVEWGPVNQPMTEEAFDRLHARMLKFWKDQEGYIQDLYGGADSSFPPPVPSLAQRPWH